MTLSSEIIFQMTLFMFYPSGRYETIVQDFIYTVDDFVADVGGYLVSYELFLKL